MPRWRLELALEYILFGDQKLTLQSPALWEREVKSSPPPLVGHWSDSQGTTLASTLGSWILVLLGAQSQTQLSDLLHPEGWRPSLPHIVSSVLLRLPCGTLQHPARPALLDGVAWDMGSGLPGHGPPPTPVSLRSGPLVRCCVCGISCL